MFAKRLKEIRIEAGITQAELAKSLNVTKSVVSDWERGKCETSFELLAKIAKFFGVSADYLIGLED